MSINKSFDSTTTLTKTKSQDEKKNPWRASYPNPADFNFNYYHLLDKAKDSGIGKNTNPDIKIAIIGAGVAGLTAARELFRSGYTNIHIYEASDRTGGRTYSQAIPGRYTTYEMGAMRMPYFDDLGSKNSVLDYYTGLFDIKTQDFPNPGGTVADTGIYLQNGLGPEPASNPLPTPQLLIWSKNNSTEPPTKVGDWTSSLLKDVYDKWAHFNKIFTDEVKLKYDNPQEWQKFWQQIVQKYWDINFRDFVHLERLEQYDDSKEAEPGYFGGLGMDDKEADLFYTIGAGDGSWGAFYEISCLYVMRTLLFGFGTKHQLIKGLFNDGGEFVGGPQHQETLKDSLGREFAGPDYLGVETFADCLLFQPVTSHDLCVDGKSLYQALEEDLGVKLFMQNSVSKLEKLDSGKIELNSKYIQEEYDIVIPTLSPWAGQLSIDIKGFEKFPKPEEGAEANESPFLVARSLKTMHWITSCKVFYPLKKRYWKESNIPQLLSTDTLLQGVYGYALEGTIEPESGVLLVSYTWEDDANKFLASEDDDKLASQLLDKLDDILLNCSNIRTRISPYVDTEKPTVIQWAKQPSYRGCAKLYRERTEDENYILLRYNQNRSHDTGIYFAGEAFSVTGGWTEPAFRGALDAVIHIIKNTGGKFIDGFDRDRDYPKHSDWTPNDKLEHNLNNLHRY